MRSFQLPAMVHVGEFIRTNPSGASTVNCQPSLFTTLAYHNSTSSVKLTVISPGPFALAVAVGFVTRSLPPDLAPGAVHSTFLPRVCRYFHDTPAPHGPTIRRI